MTLAEKIIKPKIGLLELAKQLGNVSSACKTLGYSVDIALEYPAHGQVRASNELRKMSIMVSSGGVHSIWKRNILNTLDRRLKALEKKVAAEGIILTAGAGEAEIQKRSS
ncbi:MAG: IS481 family transposase, partial [Holosporaceae bacterium]|nr:IS481 family transposase [Holosporaceae bacterium]